MVVPLVQNYLINGCVICPSIEMYLIMISVSYRLSIQNVNMLYRRIMQGRIQDFKLGGGGALKKIAPSGGGGRKFLGYFVWKITILRQKIIFFPIAERGAKIFGVIRVNPLLQCRWQIVVNGTMQPFNRYKIYYWIECCFFVKWAI